MSLFLTNEQRDAFNAFCGVNELANDHRWSLFNRVDHRASGPALSVAGTTTEWWHHAAEFLTDAAIAHALAPTRNHAVGAWLRLQTLALARRPLTDWVGPFFRDHSVSPPRGHLETAHLCWSVAVALDIAPDVFSESDRTECEERLREGIAMCERWLDKNIPLNNWRAVLSSGMAVGAVVLNDERTIKRAEAEYRLCLQMFQADGSYGESLQYANYAAFSMLLIYESLIRHDPSLEHSLPLISDGQLPRWQAYSHFYCKPLSGWGSVRRPRAANFNDSAAMFRPTADLLLYFATRGRDKHPVEAGLARWLFEETYSTAFEGGPYDRATFGFYNAFHFLAYSLLPLAAEALSPEKAELEPTYAFSNGNAFIRDDWTGKTILAINGGGDPLRVTSHLHGDLNSFILVHNQERILADPGHCCYRNAAHSMDISTGWHNTCTFEVSERNDKISGEPISSRMFMLGQSEKGKVNFDPDTYRAGAPVDRGAYRRFIGRRGEVSIVVSDAAKAYGEPIREYTRVWLQCGAHVLFVLDQIVAETPVKTTWNWVLNNRDDTLVVKTFQPDRFVARRPNAGMKLFCCHNAGLNGPWFGYMHDCYHPLPNQLGEGASGSGSLFKFVEKEASISRLAAHAIVVDGPGAVANWHLARSGDEVSLRQQNSGEGWSVDLSNGLQQLRVTDLSKNTTYCVHGGK